MLVNSSYTDDYGDFSARRRSTRNLIGIVCVLLFHAFLAYVLMNGLARKIVNFAKGPVQTRIVEDIRPKELPRPPEKPVLTAPAMPYLPPPEVTVQIPSDAGSNAIVAVQTTKPPAPAAAQPAPARPEPDHEVSARPLSGPPLKYPPRMLAAQREGRVRVECTVEADGTTNNCALLEYKGAYEFTAAALNYVKAARYSPRVRNGTPVKEEHHQFDIIFTLE